MLRVLTAGESHGPQLTVVLDGLPAGVPLDEAAIAHGMARRQLGFGRGARMQIERDQARFVGGVRFGETLGSPVAIVIENRDHAAWAEVMAPFGPPPDNRPRRLTRPRPGHADLVGMLKYERDDARDVLERASARETAARVAAGEVVRALLRALDIECFSHVRSIGGATAQLDAIDPARIAELAEQNDLRCAEGYERMRAEIEAAGREGDTVGGVFEVVVTGLPPGLGSCMAPDRKLDGRLAQALLSIPAVKGCEIGPAFSNSQLRGSQVHDEILPAPGDVPTRASNRAGGLEGGMTTGAPLVCRGAMKPISTLRRPLASIDMTTNRAQPAGFERSDVCAVPSAGVAGEAVVMLVLADALLEMFGGDTLTRLRAALDAYRAALRARMERAGA